MGISMTDHAGFGTVRLSQCGVSAGAERRRDVTVAGKARRRRTCGGVGRLSRTGMAIDTAKVFMDAMPKRLCLHRDDFSM
jgi:hypothetical protein